MCIILGVEVDVALFIDLPVKFGPLSCAEIDRGLKCAETTFFGQDLDWES